MKSLVGKGVDYECTLLDAGCALEEKYVRHPEEKHGLNVEFRLPSYRRVVFPEDQNETKTHKG